MNEQLKEEILELLANSLTIDLVTTSEYTGGLDGSGSLYADSHKIQLKLEGEIISEIYL